MRSVSPPIDPYPRYPQTEFDESVEKMYSLLQTIERQYPLLSAKMNVSVLPQKTHPPCPPLPPGLALYFVGVIDTRTPESLTWYSNITCP